MSGAGALFDGPGQFIESLAAADHKENNARVVAQAPQRQNFRSAVTIRCW